MIDQPGVPLAAAEAATSAMVTSRHGAHGDPARCYYAVPDAPAEGASKTDVSGALWCGPVLFVDGDPAAEYLRFGLSGVAAGGKAVLTAASQPASGKPSAPPADASLKRPDGHEPPVGAGGLTPPPPPPASKDAFVSVTELGGGQTVPTAPAGAVIGSVNGGIRLTALGPIVRYGSGDAARGAPAGEKLIAFKLGLGFNGAGDPLGLFAKVAVSVDGGAARPLPKPVDIFHGGAVP
ncbi:MAG: hypothetical protein FWD74_01960, partial [Actinomycetia bacterium]|nr:hypothetical protein [Actinomycetes bacterium]